MRCKSDANVAPPQEDMSARVGHALRLKEDNKHFEVYAPGALWKNPKLLSELQVQLLFSYNLFSYNLLYCITSSSIHLQPR